MPAKITKKMQNFIKDQKNLAFMATCDSKGMPNIAPKALLYVGESNLFYGDLYVDRTAANIRDNNAVSVSVINPSSCNGYQFKGRAKIATKGEVFDMARKSFEEFGFDEPVHVVQVEIEEIFFFEQGPEMKMEAA
ncbi:MAG: pyridoxamine 5'-phosphate oxidase family protein [Actinobacteria bacterium]|nr:MAG: pyridoxamine 5'-phosphate oxidase family protein [Actinomycetota bacterium]